MRLLQHTQHCNHRFKGVREPMGLRIVHGLAVENLQRFGQSAAFQKPRRADSIGLGLFIARQIVEAYTVVKRELPPAFALWRYLSGTPPGGKYTRLCSVSHGPERSYSRIVSNAL